MKYYFVLQFKRLLRTIKEAGIRPEIVLLLFPVLFYILSVVFFTKLEYANYLYPLAGIVLLIRTDESNKNGFLKNIFTGNRYKIIRFIENTIIITPFVLFLLYKKLFLEASALFIVSSAISQFNLPPSYSLVIPTPFFKKPFEFIVGFRKTFWIFPLAYFLTFMAVKSGNFNLGIFSLLVVTMVTMSYYSQPEPVFYVWIFRQNSKKFLLDKIKTAILFNLLLTAPVIIALLIAFPLTNIDLILIFTIAGILFLIANLLGKYSLFPTKAELNQMIMIGICIMFPPMLFIVLPYLYYKSNNSLDNFLK